MDRTDPTKPCPLVAFSRGHCRYHYRKTLRDGELTALPRLGKQTQLRTWVPLPIEAILRRKSRASGVTVSALIREILQEKLLTK